MDAVAEWVSAQSRVIGLVEHLSDEDAGRRVPACPAWTVRDLLAHVVGLDADVMAGDEPDDHNETWTQQQVDGRAGLGVAEIVTEWRSMTGPMQAWMQEHSVRPFADVVIHEQDLRGALDQPGAHDTDGLHAIRDQFATGLGEQVGAAGLGTLALVAPNWRFVTDDDEPVVTVRASRFDLARALMSRRTADQLQEWSEGDIGPYLALFGALGPLPETPLPE